MDIAGYEPGGIVSTDRPHDSLSQALATLEREKRQKLHHEYGRPSFNLHPLDRLTAGMDTDHLMPSTADRAFWWIVGGSTVLILILGGLAIAAVIG